MLINYESIPIFGEFMFIYFYSILIGILFLNIKSRLSKKDYVNDKIDAYILFSFIFTIPILHILIIPLVSGFTTTIYVIGIIAIVINIYVILSKSKEKENNYKLSRPKLNNYAKLHDISLKTQFPRVKISGKYLKTSNLIYFEDILRSRMTDFMDELMLNEEIVVKRSSFHNFSFITVFLILIVILEYLNISILLYTINL